MTIVLHGLVKSFNKVYAIVYRLTGELCALIKGLNPGFKGIMLGVKVSINETVNRDNEVGNIVDHFKGNWLPISIKDSKAVNVNLK